MVKKKKIEKKKKSKQLEKTRLTGSSSEVHHEEKSIEDFEAEETQHMIDLQRKKEEQKLRREISRLYIDGNVVPRTKSGGIKKEKPKQKPINNKSRSNSSSESQNSQPV